MKKQKIQTSETAQFRTNYTPKRPAGRTKKGRPSQTIQGEAYTIQQLMERAVASGQLLAEVPDSAFVDQEDMDLITEFYRPALDLTDIDRAREYAAQLKQKVDSLREHALIERREKEAEAQRQRAELGEFAKPKENTNSTSTTQEPGK